jgi:hypothetical protein
MFIPLTDRKAGQYLGASYLNALSQNAAHVYGVGLAANMPFAGYLAQSVQHVNADSVGWMIRHKFDYLHYKVVVNEPLSYFRIRATDTVNTIHLLDNESPGVQETFHDALDVSSLLTEGQWYGLWFELGFTGSVYGNVTVSRLWESNATSTEAAPTAGAYVVPPQWEHGDVITAADMNRYKSALDAARAKISDQAFNVAVRKNNTQDRGFWFIHRHRWLHYVGNGEIVDPSGVNKAEEISGEAGKFSVFDLSGVSWLAEGALYNVKDVNYAVEDFNA